MKNPKGSARPVNPEFEADLRQLIQNRQVLVVVGSGVSRATHSGSLSWRDLIKSGVARCKSLGAAEEWCQQVKNLLSFDNAAMLLAAAELVEGNLQSQGEEFGRWLRETFEDAQPEDSSLIEILASWNVPLATTNYDDLIEKVTALRPVTWKDKTNLTRVARGDEDSRVMHLHGYWENPESVVLGIGSYERVKEHEHTQAVMKAMGVTKSLLFVGCGKEGLNDPNFGPFLKWLENLEKDAEHRHYNLVLAKDVVPPVGRLYSLPYGHRYEDLVECLKRVTPEPPKPAKPKPKPSPLTVKPELPESVRYYLRRLAQETERLPLVGMGRGVPIDLPISEAYIPLKATLTRSLEEKTADKYGKGLAEHEEDVDLADVFRKAARLGERGIILLGEPGSGKTTAARQLAWRLAGGENRPEDLVLPAGTIPVFLKFRNISREALDGADGLRVLLEQETRCEQARDDLRSPGAVLWNWKHSPLLWILDGLDEVIDAEDRKKVSGWIRGLRDHRLDDWIVATCRFQGYYGEGVPLGSIFLQFRVCPLDKKQVAGFVEKWFKAVAKRLHAESDQQQELVSAKSKELLERLGTPAFQSGSMLELSTNPLMLTILCTVFKETGDLPRKRAELYAHCVRVLLEYWRRDLYKPESTNLKPYDADAAQAVLARLAWWMHQEQKRTAAPFDDLAEEAEKALATISSNAGLGLDGRGFLDRMRNEAGVLALGGEGRGLCGFLHLSFQEYLAADHATRQGLAKELARRMTESWWVEVGLLALRHSEPFCREFFRHLLQVGVAETDPGLFGRCLEESLYPAPEPFLEVLRTSRNEPRVAAVLRMFRERAVQVPELREISLRLAESQNVEVRGAADEVLLKFNVRSKLRDHDLLIDEKSGIRFVSIPAGEFRMGSLKGWDEERPVHKVRLTRGFLLGKYPVTNAEYARYLEAKEVSPPRFWGDRRFNQPEQPVMGVSWEEAAAYCEWAGVRLPTEAEWEYACRAGTDTEYSFGDDEALLEEYAWFKENSSGQTQPVGAKKPNAWGLHDMHGNVWEWCQDWFAEYREDVQVDPRGPDRGVFRVGRGGAWYYPPRRCRSAYRYGFTPSRRFNFLGFRVARSSAGQSGE